MLPLKGFRVLDMTVVWAGPYCTALLADLGAEVIRVECLGSFAPLSRGSMARPTEAILKNLPLFAGGTPDRMPGARPWNRYPIFNAHGRNKLSMTVDVRQPRGMEVFKRLVAKSDVLVENNVTETMTKLGISYEMLKELKQDIIMLRMPAYGSSGAYENYRAFGVHIEGVIGHSLLRGYSDMDPSAHTPVFMADAAGGSQGAFAVLAALYRRKRTGKGQLIELSQAENALPFLGEFFMDYSMNVRNTTTIGNRHPYAVQGCYPCRGEDRWVNITIYDDLQWQAFCRVMGNPPWTQDARFADPALRHENHDDLDTHIEEWTRQHDHYEIMHRLQEAGVPAGAVMDQRDATNDPHVQERGFFQQVSQEDCGTHWYPGEPFKMSETPPHIRRGPVRLGEDNEYIYKTILEMTDVEYAELEAEGHIGMDYAPGVR